MNEAVQNTIINSYTSIKKLKTAKYFKTWIIKILINECNHIYKGKNIVNFEEYNEESLKEISKDYINDMIQNIDFFELLKCLNYEEKMIITLFYSDDLSVKDIGNILNISQSTVTTKLSRARGKLKKILEGRELYE